MVLFQIAMGIIAALFLWGLVKLTFRALLWLIAITVVFNLIVPGAFLFISGMFFIMIGMLATLGVLFIIGALKP